MSAEEKYVAAAYAVVFAVCSSTWSSSRRSSGGWSGTRGADGAGGEAGEGAGRWLSPLRPTMLLRVGTRGSRLALTQAGTWRSGCAALGVEMALLPITTTGDRDRRSAVRRDRRSRRVREGAGGGTARRPHRRRRPLGEGHDVDRHRRAGSRRIPDARGSSRRARRRRDDRAGHADRHGIRAANRAAACARGRRSPSSRCAATSTRG